MQRYGRDQTCQIVVPMPDEPTKNTVAQIFDFAQLSDCFEQTFLAYKEHRWGDLFTRLAPQPRTVISKSLKEHGPQYIIDTGEIPKTWQYQHAMPVSENRFHIYALMANHNQSEDMGMFRFIFIRSKNTDEAAPKWLLHSSIGLGETEYDRGVYACLQWAPEHYYDPEEPD